MLLLFALAAIVLGSSSSRGREELVTWPGSFGILGVGLMLGIGLEDIDGSEDWLPYLVGGVVALLSVVGYAAVRRGAFVVTAILGLGLAYIQLADDVLVDIGDDDDQAIIAAATIAVFVLAVTAVGWLLRTRAISGVVAGVIGVVGFNAVMLVLGLAQFFDSMFGGPDISMTGGQTEEGGSFFFVSTDGGPDYDNDVYVILAIAAVLTLLWALAAALDGNPGFTVLAIAMPATLVPTRPSCSWSSTRPGGAAALPRRAACSWPWSRSSSCSGRSASTRSTLLAGTHRRPHPLASSPRGPDRCWEVA